MLEVVRFHAGDDADLGRDLEESPIALVCFDDQQLARVPSGVRADLIDLSADDETRMQPGLGKNKGQH